MKIATYNLRFGGSGRRHWAEVIAHCDPEILLVQESYPPVDHLPPLIEGEKHLNAVWTPVATENGTKWGSAIYCKSYRPRPLPLDKFQGWVAAAEIDDFAFPPHGRMPLRVFSVHAPSGMGDYAKVVHGILDLVAPLRDGCEIVLGGDFNLTVGERHVSEELKTCAADLAIQARLRDEFRLINCWQAANPNQPLTQTLRWSNRPDVPYHCDGVFAPATWQPRLAGCTVLADEKWRALSDHNPVVAEFR